MLTTPLPPGGRPDLLTKQDLLELEGSLRMDLRSFEAHFKAHFLHTILVANISMALAFVGIAFAAGLI